MERTDIHRPSAIVPADYEYVGIEFMKIESLGDCLVIESARAMVKAHMAQTGGTYSNHEHGGSCHICGASCVYTVLFYHAKSNVYIRTGSDCAQKLDMAFDQNAFKRFVDGVKGAREAQAGKAKAQVLLADAGISAAWDVYIAAYPEHTEDCKARGRDANGDDNGASYACTCDHAVRYLAFEQYEERTIRDIVGKVVRFGNISEKAAAFVKALLGKIENRAAVAAQRAAEMESAAPAPTGRVIITGRVLTVKDQERPTFFYGDSGVSTKILVQDLTGFKVWGNRCINAVKGDMITFTATVKPSDKDTKFGFFSRATKASFVNESTGEIIPDYPQYGEPTDNIAAKQAKWCELYGEAR
jgi:hypothetical protein